MIVVRQQLEPRSYVASLPKGGRVPVVVDPAGLVNLFVMDSRNLASFKRGEQFEHFGPGPLTSFFASTFELPPGETWSFVIENPLDEPVFVHYRVGDEPTGIQTG